MSLRNTAHAVISQYQRIGGVEAPAGPTRVFAGAKKGLFAQLRKFVQLKADSTQNQLSCSGSLDAVATTGGMRTSLALDF